MKPWLILCRVTILIALAVSVALYLQYLNPLAATFCGLEGGCEAVRRSGYTYLYHPALSIPLVGILAYTTLFWLSLRPAASALLMRLAIAGAATACFLLAWQAFGIRAFCWMCVIVDMCAILTGLFALQHARQSEAQRAPDPLAPSGWLVVAAVAALIPVGWSQWRPLPPVPGVIQALYVDGKINVVEFADFECPFCRLFHPMLKEAISKYPPERLNFVRMNVPLDQHPHARHAALAYVCADAQGKGEELADRLVTGELDREIVEQHAFQMGLDRRAFRQCVEAPETRDRVERETQRLHDADFVGLPTTYVGGQRFVGLPAASDLNLALELAASGEAAVGIPAAVYWPGAFAALGAAVWWGRRRRARILHGSASESPR